MSKMLPVLSLLAIAPVALADWSGNVNYGSPSRRHPSLGIHMPKVIKRQSSPSYMDASRLNFTHGVASGDPYSDSAILWTRVAPTTDNDASNVTVSGTVPLYNHNTEEYVEASSNPVCVEYVVSESEDLSDPVTDGKAYTSSDIDYTIKVEAKDLEPFTAYYYQFNVCDSDVKSPLGRTKTAPTADDDVTSLGLAVFSCSNFPTGFFNAYGNSARKDDVDFVIHLGDYIYEYATTTAARPVQPEREIFTLYDYRRRLATYRTDLDLLLSHQKFAWIPVWDDHEVSNNGYRDGSSGLNNTEESFVKDGGVSVDQRKMNAVRAYFEWMPIRQVDMDNNLRIWRSFSLGKLVDLIMLDTRNYDRSITTLDWNNVCGALPTSSPVGFLPLILKLFAQDYVTEISNDAGRTLMGSHQENWFYRQLKSSGERGATWRLIGSQIVFSRINVTTWFGSEENPYNSDAWDGYMANKNRTLKTLADNNIGNNIMMAGDSHANWVSDLVWLDVEDYDPATGSGALGAEFAGTAVTSNSPFGAKSTIAQANNQSSLLIRDNEELQWQEGYYRGYYEMQISPEAVRASYFGLPNLRTRNGYEISLANFTVLDGKNALQRPIGGGEVENGALKNGTVSGSNVTLDTNSGEWFVNNFNFSGVTLSGTK
jgi:alkaline phosphatase D